MMSWGFNSSGELGNGSTFPSNVPVQVNNMTNVKAVAGGTHSLAVRNNGDVWAWGAGIDGQLGNGGNSSSNIPVQVSSITNVTGITS